MKTNKLKFAILISFSVLTLSAFSFRIFFVTNRVQAAEYKQAQPQNSTPYPPPDDGETTELQTSVTGFSYPAPGSQVDETTISINSEAGEGYPGPEEPGPMVPSNLPYKVLLPIISRSGYNRQAAVEYADTWAHGRNTTNFPNFGTDITPECNDCTNYLNQMLLAGGHPIIWGDSDPNNSRNWFVFCDGMGGCTNSLTWSATDWMNSYIANYPNKFGAPPSPGGIEALSEGDFFLMDLPDYPVRIPNHARLVVGWGYPEEGDNFNVWSLLINQHCVDRKRVRWNYRLDMENTRFWIYHVLQ